MNYCADKNQLNFDNTPSIVIFLLASVKEEVAFSGTSIRLFFYVFFSLISG
jgi:hypothetical protein